MSAEESDDRGVFDAPCTAADDVARRSPSLGVICSTPNVLRAGERLRICALFANVLG